MSEVIIPAKNTGSSAEPLSVNWYRALSFSERLPMNTDDALQSETFDMARATKKLKRWREEKSFQDTDDFVCRLAADHLTPELLFALLGESPEELQARIVTPSWLKELVSAVDRYAGRRCTDAYQTQKQCALLDIFGFLIDYGEERLKMSIDALQQKYIYLPFEVRTVHTLFVDHLSPIFSSKIARTMALELNIARLQGGLQGETPQERFQYFIENLKQKAQLMPFLEEYVVLSRQLLIAVEHWIQASYECLDHLCHDWEQICETFSAGQDSGRLLEVEAGAGDMHHGGRSVLKLRFSSGLRLVYKPRSLSLDIHFQQTLTWLNERGQQPALRPLKLLSGEHHGWSEFIVAKSCTTEDEVARFYERLGGYLALLYVLDAADFHFENVLAAGEDPMLVDLEALFHPHVEDQNPQAQGLAARKFNYSVLRVGLLPRRLYANAQSVGIDMSGLGGHGGQLSPQPVAQMKDPGTDQMHLAREYAMMQGRANRPRLNGREVELLDYRAAFLTGFRATYTLIMRQREAFLVGPLARFSYDTIRVIVRATQFYGHLLQESFHPDLLRDALDRDRFFDRLWSVVRLRPQMQRLLAAERRDLSVGDIPFFRTFPASTDVYTSQGECIPAFFEQTSRDAALQILHQLSEQDLARQCWFIEASFAAMLMDEGHSSRLSSVTIASAQAATYEELLQAACAVGDRLGELALCEASSAYWIGIHLVAEKQWALLPSSPTLYDGTAGLVLFLSYLGCVAGETRYTELAKAGLVGLQEQLRDSPDQASRVGGFAGWGSLVYLYAHLGVLWQDPTLFLAAQEIAERIDAQLESDDAFDVISGSAGAILALAALYHTTPLPRTLEIAIRAGDHLLEHVQRTENGSGWVQKSVSAQPLAGFSHGAAGIALSLLTLAELCGEVRFYDAALVAIEYERSLFSPRENEWRDIRDHAHSRQERADYMTAWCHGAAGIGMGRLASLRYISDAGIHEEIANALRRVEMVGFCSNHSLCHGALGNLETLVLASQVYDDSAYYTRAMQHARLILDSIAVDGWLTGIPLSVETPGLMTGLAGIGYELLRLAVPAQVPSVLVLAPPTIA